MRAEVGKRERENEEKKKEKNGVQNRCFFLFVFFIRPRAGFFICAVVIFQINKVNWI